MARLDALTVRDFVALFVIVARTIAQYHSANAQQLVEESFEVADAFVSASEGQWAAKAEQNHIGRAEQKKPPPR